MQELSAMTVQLAASLESMTHAHTEDNLLQEEDMIFI